MSKNGGATNIYGGHIETLEVIILSTQENE